MNENEYAQLECIWRREKDTFCIRSHEFTKNNKPRTLLYGYYTDRTDLHVYLYMRHVHMVTPEGSTRWFKDLTDLVPDKRLYPEACDFDFCAYLKRMGVTLPFTTFSNSRTPQQYYGKVPELEIPVRL